MQSGSNVCLSWKVESVKESSNFASRSTCPPHHIHRRLAQLVIKVVALHEPNAMLASDRALHFYRALDHAMDNALGDLALPIIEEYDR